MTITALHLIQAADLLREVASGEAETCTRAPLVRVAATLRTMPNLAGVADFMTGYAHGDFDHAQAGMYLEILNSVAGSVAIG